MINIFGYRVLGYLESLLPSKINNLIKSNYQDLSDNLLLSKIKYNYLNETESLLNYGQDNKKLPIIKQLMTLVGLSNQGFNPLKIVNSFLGNSNDFNLLLNISNKQLKIKYDEIISYLGSFESFYLLQNSKLADQLYLNANLIKSVSFFDNLIENYDIDITSKFNEDICLILIILLKTILHRSLIANSLLAQKLNIQLLTNLSTQTYIDDFSRSVLDSYGYGIEIAEDITSYLVTDILNINSDVINARKSLDSLPVGHFIFDQFDGRDDGIEYDIYQLVTNGTDISNENLIAQYTMDDAISSTLPDSSGNGNDGIINGATVVAGKYNNGLNFSATDYVDCGTGIASLVNDQISVSCWIKASSIGPGAKGIFDIGPFDNNVGDMYSYINDSILYFIMPGLTISVPYTDLLWHNIILIYDGSFAKLYIDGVQQYILNYTTTLDFTGLKLIIGSIQNNTNSFDGIIDEFRIFKHALSENEINELYLNNTFGSDSILIQLINAFSNYYRTESLNLEDLILWIDFYYSSIIATEYTLTFYNNIKDNLKTDPLDGIYTSGDTLESYLLKYEDISYDILTENINTSVIEDLQNNLWLTWLYKSMPLEYLNIFILTHSYWLREKTDDILSTSKLFKYFDKDTVTSWINDIYNESFDYNNLNNTLVSNYIIPDKINNSGTTNFAANIFGTNIIHNFINSDIFKTFITDYILDPLKIIIEDKYNVDINIYEYVEKLKIFFKGILTKQIFNEYLFKSILDLVQNTCADIINNHSINPVIELTDTLETYVENEKFYSESHRQLIYKYFLNIKIFNYVNNYLSGLKI